MFFQYSKYQKKIILNDPNDKNKAIIFINPHSYVFLYKDFKYFQSVKNSSKIFIDGIGIYIIPFIANFFNKKSKYQRITGWDFFHYVVRDSYKKTFLFVGSTKEGLKKIKSVISIQNPSCKILSIPAPFVKKDFTKKEVEIMFSNLNYKKKIDYCFVGVGSPKQEKLAQLISTEMIKTNLVDIGCIASIGAVFDYYKNKPSPLFFLSRKFGLEWLYRMFKTPSIWKRTAVSLPVFIFLFIFHSYRSSIKYFKLNLTMNFNKIIQTKESFILSALNLAFFSFLFNSEIKPNKYYCLWPDGVFSFLFLKKKFKKIPGSYLISNLKIPKKISKFHVIGKLSEKNKYFLEEKYKLAIKHTQLPFGSVKKIIKKVPKIYPNELVLITLPTPKQEVIASYISSRSRVFKIICIGGGLGIASKEEQPCPKFLENLYLEFLWRLKYETRRRITRLFKTFINAMIAFSCFFHLRIDLNEK